jgi:hypothetical protein
MRCIGYGGARRVRGRYPWRQTLTRLELAPRVLATLSHKGEGKKSHPLDDGRGTHAAADAQRDQRGRLVAALELVEHGAENHRPRRP